MYSATIYCMPIKCHASFEHKTTAVDETDSTVSHKHTDTETSKISLVSSAVEKTEKGEGWRGTGKWGPPLDRKSGRDLQKRWLGSRAWKKQDQVPWRTEGRTFHREGFSLVQDPERCDQDWVRVPGAQREALEFSWPSFLSQCPCFDRRRACLPWFQ